MLVCIFLPTLIYFFILCPLLISLLLGYVQTGTISYRYRTGLIFGTEKLTVHTGPVRYRTSFGSCSHGYAIVPSRNISRQTSKRKSDLSTNFKHCRMRSKVCSINFESCTSVPRAIFRVCSIDFEPPDNDLCSACHDHPLFRGAWIISILFIFNKLTWGLDFII